MDEITVPIYLITGFAQRAKHFLFSAKRVRKNMMRMPLQRTMLS